MSGVKSATDYPRLWGIELEVTYWSNNTNKVTVNNPQFDPNFIQETTTKPRLWGIQLENTYWSNNSQKVMVNNPQFDPNFIQNITEKPRLWGIQLENILTNYATDIGYYTTGSTETISTGKRTQQMIVLPTTSTLSNSTSSYVTVAQFSPYVDNGRDVMSFAGVVKMASSTTVAGKVRVVINSIPIWESNDIVSTDAVSIFSGIIPIFETAKRRNSIWIIELQLKGTGSIAIQLLSSVIQLG